MSVTKIFPAYKDYIWGGNKLRNYGMNSTSDRIAEAWVFSYNKNGLSLDKNSQELNIALKNKLGKKYDEFEFFPYLIKLIDSNNDLSIQVHPSDEYALKNENSFGKTEMWYIIEAEKDACLYLGFKKDVTKVEVEEAIKNNTICNLLNKVIVKPGECYFVESGTVHAIGKGIVLAEIQQNSDLTYRVYDYDRVDKNGNKRELHIEKALNVMNLKKHDPIPNTSSHLGTSKYFDSNLVENEKEIRAEKEAGIAILFIKGSGTIDGENFSKGNCFFIEKNSTSKIEGNYKAITTTIK